MTDLICYVHNRRGETQPVPYDDAVRVYVDAMKTDTQIDMVDRLDLVHCDGPDNVFFNLPVGPAMDETPVCVICWECYEG